MNDEVAALRNNVSISARELMVSVSKDRKPISYTMPYSPTSERPKSSSNDSLKGLGADSDPETQSRDLAFTSTAGSASQHASSSSKHGHHPSSSASAMVIPSVGDRRIADSKLTATEGGSPRDSKELRAPPLKNPVLTAKFGLSEHDDLVDSYLCALSHSFLQQGRGYLTHECFCFLSNVFTETRVVIKLRDVVSIVKRSRFVIGLEFFLKDGTSYLFCSFVSRQKALEKIMAEWKRALAVDSDARASHVSAASSIFMPRSTKKPSKTESTNDIASASASERSKLSGGSLPTENGSVRDSSTGSIHESGPSERIVPGRTGGNGGSAYPMSEDEIRGEEVDADAVDNAVQVDSDYEHSGEESEAEGEPVSICSNEEGEDEEGDVDDEGKRGKKERKVEDPFKPWRQFVNNAPLDATIIHADSLKAEIIRETVPNSTPLHFVQFFTDEEHFVNIHQSSGDKDIVVDPLEGNTRKRHFKAPLAGMPMCPPETRMEEELWFSLSDNCLVVDVTQVSLDIPYGDTFVLETRWTFTQTEGNNVEVLMRAGTFWKKRCLMRSIIEKTAMDKLPAPNKSFLAYIREYLSQHPLDTASGSGKKTKRSATRRGGIAASTSSAASNADSASAASAASGALASGLSHTLTQPPTALPPGNGLLDMMGSVLSALFPSADTAHRWSEVMINVAKAFFIFVLAFQVAKLCSKAGEMADAAVRYMDRVDNAPITYPMNQTQSQIPPFVPQTSPTPQTQKVPEQANDTPKSKETPKGSKWRF